VAAAPGWGSRCFFKTSAVFRTIWPAMRRLVGELRCRAMVV